MSVLDGLWRRVRRRKRAEDLACQELVELITDYLDGALSPGDRTRFEGHISACDDCSTYLEQMRQTIDALGHISQEEIPASAMEELLGAFREWRQR
jgi:anti-sigma factor RsiW